MFLSLSKNEAPVAVIPITVELVPVSKVEMSYVLTVSTICSPDEFRSWAKVHYELNCYEIFKMRGEKVDSRERIVERGDIVVWDKSE